MMRLVDRLFLVVVVGRLLLVVVVVVVDRLISIGALHMYATAPCASNDHAKRSRCSTCWGHTARLSMTIDHWSIMDTERIPANTHRLGTGSHRCVPRL